MSVRTKFATYACFDIETTKFSHYDVDKSFVYAYTTKIDGEIVVDRTKEHWFGTLDTIIEKHDISLKNRLVVYVHNLSYEFQYIAGLFEWQDVFAIGSRHKIAKAVTKSGIEFRCSYLLTNQSLASVGEDVGVPKMKGDLDYTLPRHQDTPLTEAELGYIYNDVHIIDALIKEKLKVDSLKTIPMTLTGYTRRKFRNSMKQDDAYMDWLKHTPLTEEVYRLTRQAFSGGFVHANYTTSGQTLDNVYAIDISSSYPAAMVGNLYPMSKFVDIPCDTLGDLARLIDHTAFFEVVFNDFEATTQMPPLSSSKCLDLKDATLDNGRVLSAKKARIIVTNVELKYLMRAYKMRTIAVLQCKVAKSGLLPDSLITPLLEGFSDKTRLKGVDGEEEKYNGAKVVINSVYGMVASDPVHDEYSFHEESLEMRYHPTNLKDALAGHNGSKGRFLYYPWAAWVTSYARSILINTILDLEARGFIVVYCDTDSIYVIKAEGLEEFIKSVNLKIKDRMEKFESARGFENRTEPVTPQGKVVALGSFEFDGFYNQFKSLGAKRYMTKKQKRVCGGVVNTYALTNSGVRKDAVSYIVENGGFDFYDPGMTIPAGICGRTSATYNTDGFEATVTDYLGNVADVSQRGYVILEDTHYTLTLADDYANLIGRNAKSDSQVC